MYLQGQDGQRGYAMAALLVSISVMMLMMSVALPVWRHQAQREKEAELVFRAQQYARAINLYTRKAGPGNFPPSIDVLVQQRFLRKKYKDPMTKDGEFEIITAASAQQVPGIPQGGNPQRNPGRSGGGTVPTIQPLQGRSGPQPANPFSGQPGGGIAGQPGAGIMGVRSKSKESSIRVFNGGTHYNEWTFLFSNVSNRPGVPGAQGGPGGPGGAQVPGVNGGRGAGSGAPSGLPTMGSGSRPGFPRGGRGGRQ